MILAGRFGRTLVLVNWLILLGVAAGVVVLTWVLDRIGLVDLSNKANRGGSGGTLTMMDEVFAPTRQETQAEFDRQSRLPTPAPTPADDDHDLLSGNVLIRVPKVRTEERGAAQLGARHRSS